MWKLRVVDKKYEVDSEIGVVVGVCIVAITGVVQPPVVIDQVGTLPFHFIFSLRRGLPRAAVPSTGTRSANGVNAALSPRHVVSLIARIRT